MHIHSVTHMYVQECMCIYFTPSCAHTCKYTHTCILKHMNRNTHTQIQLEIILCLTTKHRQLLPDVDEGTDSEIPFLTPYFSPSWDGFPYICEIVLRKEIVGVNMLLCGWFPLGVSGAESGGVTLSLVSCAPCFRLCHLRDGQCREAKRAQALTSHSSLALPGFNPLHHCDLFPKGFLRFSEKWNA